MHKSQCCYNRRMRRLLIIFMLLTFPFQVSWAAVCAYCQEQCIVEAAFDAKPAAKPQQQQAGDSADTPQAAADAECACCHMCASIGMTTPFMPPLPDKIHAPLPERASADILSSVRPERPERPKWTHAA